MLTKKWSLIAVAMLGLCGPVCAQTRPDVTQMVLSPCAANVPIAGNGSGAPAICASALTLGAQQTTQGALTLANTAAGAFATTLQSSNSATAAWTFTLPPTAGSNNNVLTTNGSGTTSWTAESSIGVSSFTAGTTGFTPSSATAGAITLAGTLVVANGGTNCSTASITCFNNITGFSAAGTTGTTSTNLVFSTSPTLVTPTLGAATATSINGLTISTTTGTLTVANSKTLTDTSGIGADLLLGATGGGFAAYGGTSCSSQFLTALSAAGAGTCYALGTGVYTALGVNVGSAGAFVVNGGALGTPSSGTVTNLTGTASININGTVGATTAAAGLFTTLGSAAHTITSASANALAVGLNGATNPAFNIDASTASQAAGLDIVGAATGGTVAIKAIDSGSNTNLTINAKGSGTIGIGSVSTGAVTITPATTVTGTLTASNAFSAGSVTGPLATNAVKGVMEGDTTTISCTAGVCTAVGAAASSIDAAGATSISNGTSNALLFDSSGNVGKISVVNSAVLVTSSGGVPSESTTLPSGLSAPSFTVTTAFTATGLVTLADVATQATNTVLVNATSGTASPTAESVSSCSASGDALIWTTNTGFGCTTGLATLASPTFSGTVTMPDSTTNTSSGWNQAFVGPSYTTSSGTYLNVGGSVGTLAKFNDSSATSGHAFMQFYSGGTAIGSITNNANTGTAFNATSDKRLKTDIDVASDVGVLRATVVHDFVWKSAGTKGIGIFAQDEYGRAPNGAVTPGGDDPHIAPWQVDYSKYVPSLIVGWQDHERRLEQLEPALAEIIDSCHHAANDNFCAELLKRVN